MQVNQTSINTITTTYSNYLSAGASYGKTMQEIASKLNGTPCPKLIEALAKTHATHYKCTTVLGNRGNWVFEVKGVRLDSARKSWERNVATFFVKKSSGVKKQVDAVQSLVKKFNALSKAEKARFLKSVA